MDPSGPHVPSGQAPLGGGLGGIDTIEVGYYLPVSGGSGYASQKIRFFESERSANEAFERMSRSMFSDSMFSSWTDVPQGSLPPIRADQFRLACSTQRSHTPACGFTARYGQYALQFYGQLIALDSSLTPHTALTIPDFIAIVARIDQKMAATGLGTPNPNQP
jgi:hypothetical protein